MLPSLFAPGVPHRGRFYFAAVFEAAVAEQERTCSAVSPFASHRSHMAVLAGLDFFKVEVLTWRGLATYCVLFFLHLETRRVTVAGVTRHPGQEWMMQMARNGVDAIDGPLLPIRFAPHDRDSKSCASFQATLRSGGVQPLRLPARSPNLNAFAESWVRSIKSECLSKLILFGEASLRRTIAEFLK